MSLTINHLHKQKNMRLDRFAQEKFNEHIIHHFDINPDLIHAELTITADGDKKNVALHFHYKKKHSHLHADDGNIYKSVSHVFTELERSIRKDKLKVQKKHYKSLRRINLDEQVSNVA